MKKFILLIGITLMMIPFQFAFADNDYPIDLLKNQKWRIEITEELGEFSSSSYRNIFWVLRDGEKILVEHYQEDVKTGRRRLGISDYSGSFLYNQGDYYLELSRCWYRYKYIKEDFTCNSYRIPVEIKQQQVKGEENINTRLFNYDTRNFKVIILGKNKKEVECNFKGETFSGQKLYYSKSSGNFDNMYKFMCFETKASAEASGYRLNVWEGGVSREEFEEQKKKQRRQLEAQKQAQIIHSFSELKFKKIEDFKIFAKKTKKGVVVMLWKPNKEFTSIVKKYEYSLTNKNGKNQRVILHRNKLLLFKSTEKMEYVIEIIGKDKDGNVVAKSKFKMSE